MGRKDIVIRGAGILVVAGVLAGGGSYIVGGGDPEEFWSGTFDCYGTTTYCTATLPDPASCTETIAASALDATLESAATTGGEVICLNAGSTGTVDITDEEYGSTVTVQPSSGAAVVVNSEFGMTNVDNLHVTGNGGGGATMVMDGSQVDASNSLSDCSLNIEFDHITYRNSGAIWDQRSTCSSNMNMVWHHNVHPGIDGGFEEYRVRIEAGFSSNGPSAPIGLQIRDSLICCSDAPACQDGIATGGDPYGVVIGPGNEFTGNNQTGCGPHVDAIQDLGARNMTVIGNWFHNNDLSGGTLQSCGSSGLLVINNVFANVAYHDSYSMGAPKGITLKHNVFRGNGGQGASGFCTPPCGDDTPTVYTSNIFNGDDDSNVTRTECSVAEMPIDMAYNLNCATCSSEDGAPPNINGTPVFKDVDGSSCTGTACAEDMSYYGWELHSSSPGYNAGADSTSVGIGPEHADGT